MADQPEDSVNMPPKRRSGPGRLPVLDETRRRKILALLANGSSRRVAARIAGCSHSTIVRTAQRDPEFAAELDAAEHKCEIEALRQIRTAAQNGRYWRAAAWLLERRNPRDYARRSPTTLSEEDAAHLAMRVAEPIVYEMTDEQFDRFQDRLYEAVRAFYEEEQLAKYLPIPPPGPPVYVSRNNDAKPEERKQTLEELERELDEWEAGRGTSPPLPSSCEPVSGNSAPRPPDAADKAEREPSPQPMAIAPLPTTPTPSGEVAV
jgi:hypothetical protein